MGSGTSCRRRIERRRLPAVAMKMAVMAWLQGTRRRMRRGGASWGRDGAPELIGRVRGGRWLWMRRRRPPVALGGAPNRERERARASRERDSGRGRLRGVARGLGEEAGGGQGKQEVARAAASRCLSSWQGGRRQGGWRWAGLARWAWWAAEVSPGKVSLLCLLFLFQFCFLLFNLFCHCFEFKNNSNNAKNSSKNIYAA